MAFATRTHPVLYLLRTRFPRPYLNMFRGEPAISELDWPFTPTLKSSERFSTHNGSVLHRLLRRLLPPQGQIPPASGLPPPALSPPSHPLFPRPRPSWPLTAPVP